MSTRQKEFNEYSEAAKVDRIIHELLGRHPINTANVMEWVGFERTVASSLKIIRKIITDTLGRNIYTQTVTVVTPEDQGV